MSERILLLTDSASDIPRGIASALGIRVLSIPISHEGREFREQIDFTPDGFYELLLGSPEIPTTAHITPQTYLEEYAAALREGYTHVINVTINSGGSNMYESACMAVQLFAEEYGREARALTVDVVDSHTYTMAYGAAVIEAARMARRGVPAARIVPFLHDWFSRVGILFGVYSLDQMKKSGRISGGAACVGELRGFRPVVEMLDGEPVIVARVRGDRNVVPTIERLVLERLGRALPETQAAGVQGALSALGGLARAGMNAVGALAVGGSSGVAAGGLPAVAAVYSPRPVSATIGTDPDLLSPMGDADCLIVVGTPKEEADALALSLSEKLGSGEIGCWPVGASVAINCGPRVVAVCYLGERHREI